MELWNDGPGNKADRGRLAQLTADQSLEASRLAESKYDGTRTVARCWAEALDEVISTAPKAEWLAGKRMRPLDNSIAANKHEYRPGEGVGQPCEVCGFGRHHAWH